MLESFITGEKNVNYYILNRSFVIITVTRGKVHPITGHEGPEVE
jgi:hypothetical protein